MNISVAAVYIVWVVLCFLVHTTFGGFCGLSGLLEGFVGVGIASLFWTKEKA